MEFSKEDLRISFERTIGQYLPDYKFSTQDQIDFYTISMFCSNEDLINVIENMRYFVVSNVNLPGFMEMCRKNDRFLQNLYENSLATCVKRSVFTVQEDKSYMSSVKKPSELFSDLQTCSSQVDRCRSCHSTNVSTFTQQGRSSDEAANVYQRCHDCEQIKRIG